MGRHITTSTAASLLTFDDEECRLYTRHHAKSFYFSSFLLPAHKRAAAFAVYAFCRCADDLVDNASDGGAGAILSNIGSLRAALDDAYHPSFVRRHPHSAFARTVQKYDIPREYFNELLEGVCMDLTAFRYETFAELDRYCYRVASVVGLIMTKVFGYSNEAALTHAADLGTAMQLTNILRDVGTDLDLSRIYLPQEDLRAFGYSEDELRAHLIDDRFVSLMQFQIQRARNYYAKAEQGVRYLTDDGSRTTVVVMSRIYSSILDKIEHAQYDIFSARRYVSMPEKLALTAKYLLGPARHAHDTRVPDVVHQQVSLTAGH